MQASDDFLTYIVSRRHAQSKWALRLDLLLYITRTASAVPQTRKMRFLKKPQTNDFFETCSKLPSFFPKIWLIHLYREIFLNLKSVSAQCVEQADM